MPLETMAAISVGTSLAKYGVARYGASKRKYTNKELERQAREGLLSPEEEANIIGQQNRTLSSQAQSIQARTQGRLISQGMEGSISGTRALQTPNLERMRQLGYTSRDIAASESGAQSRAKAQYADEKQAYDDQTRGIKQQALGGLVQGVGSALGQYAMGKYAQGQQDDATALEQSRYDTGQKEDIMRYEQGRLDKLAGNEDAFRTQLAKSLSGMSAEQQKAFIQQLIATGLIQVG